MTEAENIEIIKLHNVELEEKLRVCEEDCRRKDEHIQVLSSMEVRKVVSPSSPSIESKAEVASLQVQLGFLQDKMRELECDCRNKDRELEELRGVRGSLQTTVDTTAAMAAELQTQVASAETLLQESRCANERSELAIATLQKELQEATSKVVHLEAHIREIEATRSIAETSKEDLSANINQFYKDLTVHLCIEADSDPGVVLSKIKQLTLENHTSKGEIESLKSSAEKREQAYLESRETLRAMMQGMHKDKGDLEEFIRAKRHLSQEVEKAHQERKAAEQKCTELEKKVNEAEGMLKKTQRLLSEKEAMLSKIDLEKRETSYNALNINREFDTFKETLSGLLGSSFSHCPVNEEAIKERVKRLTAEAKEKDHSIRQLEERLKTISDQYERNFENSKDSEIKTRRIELEYLDLKDRIRQLEKELSVRDVTRDELRAEKEKFFNFLRKLSSTLKMDPYLKEHDLPLVFKGILERTAQVVHKENDRNLDTNQTIINLQKRVRHLKDQLHSRELHLELMRKKMTNKGGHLSDVFDEVDPEEDFTDMHKVAKMQKKLEHLRDENNALKAELFDCSDAKLALDSRSKEIEVLQHNLGKLERVRQRQAERIADLTKNIELCDAETNQTKFVSENTVQSLASELRTLKSALDRSRKAEQEALNFRRVVGRMLGLDVDDLAIPNYDIIRRLERLTSGPSPGETVAVPVQRPVTRPGYEDASRLLGRRHRRSPHSRLHADKGRPSSLSPDNDLRDRRKY